MNLPASGRHLIKKSAVLKYCAFSIRLFYQCLPSFLSISLPITAPAPAPTTPPTTAPATRFFLFTTAPVPAPTTPPITAPFAVLLQPVWVLVVVVSVSPSPELFVVEVVDVEVVFFSTAALGCVTSIESFTPFTFVSLVQAVVKNTALKIKMYFIVFL